MKEIRTDTLGQPYIQWQQFGEGWKRAWIQRKTGDKDWADTGRYLNVVWAPGENGNPSGNPTDFPIFLPESVPDHQILEAFVAAVCVVTGCPLP